MSPSVTGLLALVLLTPAGPPGYKLETTETKRIEGVLTCQVRVPRLSATDWFIVAARAPELPGQVHVTTKVEPPGTARYELSPLHRPIMTVPLAARGTAREKGFQLRVTYQATLRARRLVPLAPGEKPPRVTPLRSDERQAYLAATHMIDFKAREFQRWLDDNGLRRRQGEADLDVARRVFARVRDRFAYRYPTGHDGRATTVCRAGAGDCGSFSAVFVAALRANGIPARVLLGRWAESSRPARRPGEPPDNQNHVKAEFYLEGVGWVPADPTQAQGDRSPGRLRYFASDPGDFLVENVDYDLLVDLPHFGRQRLTHLQGISYWASGPGSFDGESNREDWQVRRLGSR